MDSPNNLHTNNEETFKRIPRLRRGLVLQFFTIVILPLSVLLIITAFVGLSLHQQSMRELAAERDERTVRSAANNLGSLIQQRVDITQKLANDVQTDASLDELNELLMDVAELPELSEASLAYYNANGDLLVSTGKNSFWDNLNKSALVDLITVSVTGDFTTHSIITHNDDNPHLILMASSPDRSVVAALAFPPSNLIERTFKGVFPPHGEYGIYVVGDDQQVLYRIGEGDLVKPIIDHPGIRQALDNQTGFTYMKVGNDEHIVAYSPVEPLGWALVIEEPWSTIASRMLRITENAPLVLIPIVVLTVLALWFSSRYIIRPLQALESRAVELGWGNYEAIEESVGGIVEIRNLQGELVHLAQKVSAAQKGLRGYIGAITLGQEEERRRLAHELHDDTLQSLIALNQRLQLIQLSTKDDPQMSQHSKNLNDLQIMVEGSILELRRITRALRPIFLEDLGLVAALEMLARETEQTGDLSVEFSHSGSEIRITPEEELALYRIAQEALTNVIKHAEANSVRLSITYEDDKVLLSVSDNGAGFDVPDSRAAFAPGDHFGLLGMHERAEMIGARFKITSNPGGGSTVSVELLI